MSSSNRVATLLSRRVPQMAQSNFTDAWGDFEKLVEPYAQQALLKRLAQLESKVAAREKELTALQEKYELYERLAIRFSSALLGARNLVASFAHEHVDLIQDVVLGWADSEFRFLIISKSEQFDWDLCDEITDLEAALVEDYADVPLSVKCVPGIASDEIDALLEARISTMIWNPGDAKSK